MSQTTPMRSTYMISNIQSTPNDCWQRIHIDSPPLPIHRVKSVDYSDDSTSYTIDEEEYWQALVKSAPQIPLLDGVSKDKGVTENRGYVQCEESGWRLAPRLKDYNNYVDNVTHIAPRTTISREKPKKLHFGNGDMKYSSIIKHQL
mmetsp:Transcript_18153/g.20913  ORF Transcript_18153/g.20913 Transcript_18153/m.20913 type:complete len:146 (+) Transcript_18153:84-521(+)